MKLGVSFYTTLWAVCMCSSNNTHGFVLANGKSKASTFGANNSINNSELKVSTSSSDTKVCSSAISGDNLALLSDRGRAVLEKLVAFDDASQRHVYEGWPEVGIEDEEKIRLGEQLADLDDSYPGGLVSYLSKAKTLLAESAAGSNPFEDYTASVPVGESLTYDAKDDVDGGMTFAEAERIGLTGIGDAAFVLVAGGLGERLGYSGIKLSLETNLVTNQCYLAVYVEYILALQKYSDKQIPLVIMTSGDTDPLTRKLLEDNDNFGMAPGQIQIVMQDKVPALKNGSAGLSMKDKYTVETKPHGHGDVHHLLLKHGHVDRWEADGVKHVIFLQDTNALVINGILATLGVSISRGFQMNSICIPRLAGEAAGAITKLDHKTDPSKSLVINVEYNQLDPLLRTQGDKQGDVADPITGFSPYPGNANNLVMELSSYATTLRGEDQGVVVEFVNPKYKDETRTEFKKPTRLECMMQDFPKLLQKEIPGNQVGFTELERWFSFSPAKNSLESGVESVLKGNAAPGTMSSAESDMYVLNQRKLQQAGVTISVSAENMVMAAGIPVTAGPRVILTPRFAITQEEMNAKITGGEKDISITERSSLILDGEQLEIKSLTLDGALVIRASHPDAKVTVDGLSVSNQGWEIMELTSNDVTVPEEVAIRGYTMAKKEALEFVVDEPGEYVIGSDAVLKKLD
mmetsp:Transcript_21102/g.32201  ORF Transcript_21102/g.32201 Transcript_21102/m.32201 type:complete len:688 (+) Transcript_21102:85-2148(+)|eukprot:CAMPEP_0196821812 /NCGR_PEP_ID=MMETSP1362-20130617/80972_1 /TAXON_ID=163516 /ORGANISM="Leptocylindrus danicus, Strain CCMP1856" /LENGTH=687 /DNA_ID=CAMNT_0042201153 /DNA_START=40 /DNA_END=2103 /DNA_ORIENTATION=+